MMLVVLLVVVLAATTATDNGDYKDLKTTEIITTEKVPPSDCPRVSREGDTITWLYHGTLVDGTIFDAGQYWATLGAGQVIVGVDKGMREMCVNEKRRLILPPHEAYGENGYPGSIPPNSVLIFDVVLEKIDRPDEEL